MGPRKKKKRVLSTLLSPHFLPTVHSPETGSTPAGWGASRFATNCLCPLFNAEHSNLAAVGDDCPFSAARRSVVLVTSGRKIAGTEAERLRFAF